MSKPNLPPPSFYQKHEDVCGTEVGPPTPFWNQAAVEEAVRQALAAQQVRAWLIRERRNGTDPMFTTATTTEPYVSAYWPLAIIPGASDQET